MAVGDTHEVNLSMSSLQATHTLYDQYDDEWEFLQAAYDGARALVAYGAIIRHERESQTNFDRRVDEAYGFSYSKSIVELFNFYLFKGVVKRQLGELANDELWLLFMKDCNLESDSFEDFLLKVGKAASIQGQCGILVDKPTTVDTDTGEELIKVRQDELDNYVYPYVSLYKSLNVLDWEYERDEFNRPVLAYLKLKDDDGVYRIWTLEDWQVWQEPETEGGTEVGGDVDEPRQGSTTPGKGQAELIASGPNTLGEIPWVWVYNAKTDERGIGLSDITDIARIDASIMRNLSEIEECITYGAFPMLLKPSPEKGPSGITPDQDEVGITAVVEFDPERPEAKPSWLEAAVSEPIQAILNVIAKKIEEIYRTANAGGMASMEVQTQARSGAALKAEFQLLNAKLVAKGLLLEKAELEIIRLWLRWQLRDDMFVEVSVERPDTYEVQNLAEDLENMLTSTAIVTWSDTFQKKIQKKVVRLMLPGEPDDELDIMYKEIDDYEPPEFEFPDMGGSEEGGVSEEGAVGSTGESFDQEE